MIATAWLARPNRSQCQREEATFWLHSFEMAAGHPGSKLAEIAVGAALCPSSRRSIRHRRGDINRHWDQVAVKAGTPRLGARNRASGLQHPFAGSHQFVRPNLQVRVDAAAGLCARAAAKSIHASALPMSYQPTSVGRFEQISCSSQQAQREPIHDAFAKIRLAAIDTGSSDSPRTEQT